MVIFLEFLFEMGAVGMVTHIIAASVVCLKNLPSCSNYWQCLDGSIAFCFLS